MKLGFISFIEHLSIICLIVAYLKPHANLLFHEQLKITKTYTGVESFDIS